MNESSELIIWLYMTDVQSSKSLNWMIGECLKSTIQLDFKQYQMIWNFLKWCCDVENYQTDWNLNIEFESHHTDFEMNQSHFEANREIEQCLLMIYISVSQHCLINIRTLICHYKINAIQQKSNSLYIFKKRNDKNCKLFTKLNNICLQYSASFNKRLTRMNRFLEDKKNLFKDSIECMRQSCLWFNHIHCW